MSADCRMLATTACEKHSASRFRQAYQEYRSRLSPGYHAIRVKVGKDVRKAKLGEVVQAPQGDAYYIFDARMMQAIGDAIEELALARGSGELTACLLHFANFAPKRDRYQQLSQKLEAVHVWGSGHRPRACGKVDFISAHDPALARYWTVSYHSRGCQAVLLCRQLDHVASWPEKKFVGFFSFNPYLVQLMRKRFNLLCSCTRAALAHWEEEFPMPEFSMREVERHVRGLRNKANGRMVPRPRPVKKRKPVKAASLSKRRLSSAR